MNTITRLAGNTNDAMLRINNASTGANATALDLQVAPGKPPMKVNSTVEVEGLNVDSLDGKNSTDFALGSDGRAFDANKLDGKDSTAFVPTKTYQEFSNTFGNDQLPTANAQCDVGDVVLSGGFSHNLGKDDTLTQSIFDGTRGWKVAARQEDNLASGVGTFVYCADLPPLR